MKKKALLLAAALAGSNAIGAQTPGVTEPAKDEKSVASDGSNGVSNTDTSKSMSRQKLVDALRSMKENPAAIEFHSAMCYKMAMPPDTFEYSCPACGKATMQQYNSPAGQLARQIASLRRSLPNLPAKITVNETSLCQHCSKGAAPELVFTTECGGCKASFNWKIVSDADLFKFEWLFLDYPFTSLDVGPGKGSRTDPAQVKEMVEFVSGCIFCPKCVNELQLGYSK